jgi:4-hydroxythreonine-4-phosphate dehydrogenase
LKDKPVIAITMGDPGGIGPEIVLKALNSREVVDICRPVVVGDLGVLDEAKRALPISTHIPLVSVDGPGADTAGAVPVIDLVNVRRTDITQGRPGAYAGRAVIGYIEKAVSLALEGSVDAVVTAPISKESLRLAGSPHPGHTEMLAELTRSREFGMMLLGGGLRVILVTIHCPLKDVPAMITKDAVLRTIRLARSACADLGIMRPRIAVAALNPHAGEAGIFGSEEADHILPACDDARALGIDVTGPLPPDTVYYRANKGEFDIVVSMYHDQGLIPLKLLAFDTGVNVTVGLPIVRTSVDHGTAFDIAGKGMADPSSLIEAIHLAAGIAKRRKAVG